MQQIITIRFDSREREILRRIPPSLGVGFPDQPYERSDHRQALLRAVHGVARSGATLSRADLLRAREGLDVQAYACAMQSSVAYWRDRLQVSEDGPIPNAPARASSALITDPVLMCEYLADTRLVQARECAAALEVVQAALRLALEVGSEE